MTVYMKFVLPLLTLLCLAAVLGAGCTVTNPQLAGSSWRLASYSNATGVYSAVISGTNVTATFGTDKQMTGSSGCNQYSAGWSVNGNAITITQPGVTLMYCAEPAGVMDQEQAYLADIQMAKTWAISSDGITLTMKDASGKVILSYTKAPLV
jgi:heat shock protein HslJ